MVKLLKSLLITVLAVMLTITAHGQAPRPPQWGRLASADFLPRNYSLDSSAGAVVIADIGSTEFEGNQRGGFSMVFRFYRRAHVLRHSGYAIADVEIPLYAEGDAVEELAELKAVTYNLINGKIEETRLDQRTGVFSERRNAHQLVKRFSLPNVREGSVIEYQYTIRSEFVFNLQPWNFQGDYPRLWSEYTVSIPEFYYYVTLWQGYQPFFIREQKDKVAYFTHTEEPGAGPTQRTNFRASVTSYHWAMKDVPVLKEEAYTSTMQNHLARIEFQLAELRPPFPPRLILGAWTDASQALLQDELFGLSLGRENPWLTEALATALGNATTALEKARHIYNWVQESFTCTNHNARLMDQPMKNLLKGRSGNVAEINLLLVAMLQKAGLMADPVLLGTRSHGYTYELYPLLDRFNYVIALLTIGDKTWYLDASRPGLGFGQLDPDCYNGHARVIDREARAINLDPDSLAEKSVISVFLLQGDGRRMTGTVQLSPGQYAAQHLRELYRGQGIGAVQSAVAASLPAGFHPGNFQVDSVLLTEEPLAIRFDLDWTPDSTRLIFLDPLFGQGLRENPFRSPRRLYPVEMPYTLDETFMLQIELPPGYEVDELPEQALIRLNENNDGIFEYRILEENGVLSLRSRLRLRRSFFQPEEYNTLRSFFDLVVRKHNEQLVLRRKP